MSKTFLDNINQNSNYKTWQNYIDHMLRLQVLVTLFCTNAWTSITTPFIN